MNGTTLLAAQRAPALINRQKELETIRRAIYRPEADLEIVLIRGAGGMGKSRLVEEVLWRGGNWRVRQRDRRGEVSPDWEWTSQGQAIVSDIIDMNDVALHSRADFMHAVRDALIWEGNGIAFPKYDAAYNEFLRQRAMQGDYAFLKELEKRAEGSFFSDYRQNAERQRLVLVLDTVEKLYPIGGTHLLLETGLLRPEDIAFYTYQWLLQQIKQMEQNTLPNTTLLLVGRGEEGKVFFEEITQAAHKNPHCKATALEITPFSLEDTNTYFKILAEDWEQQARADAQFENIAHTISNIAADGERTEILWIYTAGQPVRLALYTDLIVEDWTLPPPFQKTLEEARQAQASPQDLEQARQEIEAGFIRLLFGGSHMRTAILQALARAPRGLDAEQLHYVLTSSPDQTIEDWQQHSNNGSGLTREQIEQELEALRRLALVKIRPDGRLGLQDEVYRIYARALAGEEQQRQAEGEARQKLYRQLVAWAEYQRQKYLQEVISYQVQDESRLSLGRPSEALKVSFPLLSLRDQQRRDQARAHLRRWELENLHYSVLSNFSRNFNHILFEFGDAERIANDEDGFAILQAERWQLLYDPAYALEEFGNIAKWASLERRRERPLQALKRIALQDDVTGWIKLFVLRKEYKRAIEFAQALETKIGEWTSSRQDDPNFLAASWMHTLARHERALWKNYAYLMIGEKVTSVLEEMKTAVEELERLLEHTQEEMVFPERGEGETGFRAHPAESKVQRLVALYYNYMGYGYANLGQIKSAQEAYGKALRAMRKVEFRHMEATARNNLARVLSDRGYTRGRRVCLDALELRKKLAAEVPIALSYNTLALIDNDHLRPDLAWIESAIALAYFRKANDPRGRGLALLQLGEALRRLAKRANEPYHLRGDSPDIALQTAEQALTEAIEIFTHGQAAGERIRLVEAYIEKGCLERDWIRFVEDFAAKERHYRDAVYYLEQAIDLAEQLGNKRLELDARVNIAWTHYHFNDFHGAREVLQAAEQQIPSDACLQPGKAPPSAERDDAYLYQQLSKMDGLRGRMALEEFRKIAEQLKQSVPDREERRHRIRQDEHAQRLLEDAARAYVRALGYSQLHSPRSIALTVTYDAVYDYVKEFNLTELEDFYEYAQKTIQEYRLAEIVPLDMSRLDTFLEDTFGIEKGRTQ